MLWQSKDKFNCRRTNKITTTRGGGFVFSPQKVRRHRLLSGKSRFRHQTHPRFTSDIEILRIRFAIRGQLLTDLKVCGDNPIVDSFRGDGILLANSKSVENRNQKLPQFKPFVYRERIRQQNPFPPIRPITATTLSRGISPTGLVIALSDTPENQRLNSIRY